MTSLFDYVQLADRVGYAGQRVPPRHLSSGRVVLRVRGPLFPKTHLSPYHTGADAAASGLYRQLGGSLPLLFHPASATRRATCMSGAGGAVSDA